MTSFIQIVRHPYEEPHHLNLVVSASNGRQSGEIEMFVNADALGVFASELRKVPCRQREATWESGSEAAEDSFEASFRLRAYQISAVGECAIEIRMKNNEPPPGRHIAEFSIRATPADLDRLAALLERFGRLEHAVLEWAVTSGELRG